MPGFTTVQELPVPPDRMFAFLLSVESWGLWSGYGPMPGIVRAERLGGTWGVGTRVRVHNTDGSVHHERITCFEPPVRYAVTMELPPKAQALMSAVDETLVLEPTATGTRLTRTFTTTPRAWWATPLVWAVTLGLLRPAARRHNEAAAAHLAASQAGPDRA